MKIVTVLGTRPEIIRLSRIIPKLDAACKHVLVHTGQNFEYNLSEGFFDELGIRKPDIFLECSPQPAGAQIADILHRGEAALKEECPDRLLILGDTNSGLISIIAKRLGIKVYHMEAGNRCFDDSVPEEVNRRVIDHSSDVLMPYTERSRSNLIAEGIHSKRVFVVGNPIREVMEHYLCATEESDVIERLGLCSYFLATIHRAETVDVPERLSKLLRALDAAYRVYGHPIIVSAHPRLQGALRKLGYVEHDGVRIMSPFGFRDFQKLMRGAMVVLTDSGTVQEECCILGIKCVILRDVTERPEILEAGGAALAGIEPESILRAIELPTGFGQAPSEYLRYNVSDAVVGILVGQ